MKTLSISLMIMTGLSACTTYQKEGTFQQYLLLRSGGGYSDKHMNNGNYYIKYKGVAALGKEKTIEYWEMRASELCPHGYTIVSEKLGSESASSYGGFPGVVNYYEHPYYEGEIKCDS